MSDGNPTTDAPSNWALLASEQFGGSFHGEVPKPEPVEDAAPLEVQEDPPEVRAETAQPDEAEAQDQVEEVTISSIEQLLESQGYDPEWFDSLEVPVKINGQPGRAKLADVKASFQIQQAAEQRLAEAKERARAETTAIAEKREQLNQQFNVTATLIQQAEQLLQGDVSKVNWDKLRNDDPAEFSARQLEYSQRQAQIQQMKQNAIAQYNQVQQQSQSEESQRTRERLEEESRKLFEKVPEWKDPEKAKTEKQMLAQYLVGAGMSQDEVANATDHRLIVLARKAMLYDKGQSNSDVSAKKVLTIPKVMKPGAPKTPEQSKSIQKAQMKQRLQRSGSLEDALALLRTR
jgi:hypothetical protein